MKINKVIFKNFKSYVNETTFNFSNRNHISVISGENGNGKTSFLEGVSLAFFGCKVFGSDSYTKEYTTFVASRLSRDSDSNEIQISIEYSEEGIDYNLTRKYIIVDDKIEEETLEIIGNGKVVRSSKFIEKYDYLIMKQLFLDGEIITRVIEESKIDAFIQTFINTAFNIKVFDQISKDLDALERREFKKFQTNEHKILEKAVNKLIDKKSNVEKHLRRNNDLMSNFNQQLKVMKKDLDKRGIEVGSSLQQLIRKNETLYKSIVKNEESVKSFMLDDIHSLLHGSTLDAFVSKLDETRSERVKAMNAVYDALEKGKEISKIDDYISLDLEMDFVKNKNSKKECDLKEAQRIVKELRQLKVEFEANKKLIAKTNEGRGRLDELDEYDRVIDNVESLERENENLLIERDNIEEELAIKQIELNKFNEQIMSQKIENNFSIEKKKLKNIVEKYARIKTNEFNDKIALKSLSILQNYFLRKTSLIDQISLKDGVLNVYKDGRVVNFKNFSAGEKQMLVVSVLFAIIEVANLDIPLVLDSFVGRLDVGNTNSILNYVKNNIKTQVIMLTTDSEINSDELELLKDKLGSCYTLQNDGYSTFIEEVTL